MYGQSDNFEHSPTRAQKTRMDDFLYELKQISRRYDIVVDADVEGIGTALIDARNDRILGYGLTYLLDGGPVPAIAGYDCEQSIVDGDWLVRDDQGDFVEQKVTDGREITFRRRNIRR